MPVAGKIVDCALVACSAGKKAVQVVKIATWNKDQQVSDQDIQNILGTMMQFTETKEKFFRKMPKWRNTRQTTIDILYEIANECGSLHRDCNIANVTGSSVGAAGGLMALVGLALAPVTFGVSLSLTIAGAATGVAGATTNIVTSIVESSKMKGNRLQFFV